MKRTLNDQVEIYNLELGEAQLATVAKALRVVLHCYGLSRKERRKLTELQLTEAG